MVDPTRTAAPPATATSDPLGTVTADPSGTVTGNQGVADTQMPTTAAPPPQSAAGPTDRYVLGPELARGGMGVVCRATDTVFGREVAVKVLQHRFDLESGAARRFADEARITGQLQHPAIPPVHDLGTLPDGRPFLAMKLIRGDTLDQQLKGRSDLAEQRGRFVAVFEQICQALAYAHVHRVIHRDLKPANVMVGNFGEVQVMDWGLAKVLTDESVEPQPDEPPVSDARTGDDDRTEAGSILGTPGYMPPEQATGKVAQIGPRSDVFGLGGILAVILSGKPPFVGGTTDVTLRLNASGRVDECFARLDASGADPELVALCKRCLTPDTAGRPADADEVARSVAELRQAADERARRAEQERAQAEVRNSESRKRRRVQTALAAAVGLLVTGGGAAAWWVDRQAGERRTADLRRQLVDEQRAAVETARLGRNAEAVGGLLAQAADALGRSDVATAKALLNEAAKRAAEGGAADLLPRIAAHRAEVRLLLELDAAERHRWNLALYHRVNPSESIKQRQAALQAFGADPDHTDPAAVAALVAASAVRKQLVTALDRQLWFRGTEPVREALRLADPDSYRDDFRDAVLAEDTPRILELAADPRALELPSGFASSLGESDRVPAARRREVLEAAVARDPNDVKLLMALGVLFPLYGPVTEDERLVWFQAAVAAAPTNAAAWNNLAASLLDWREHDRAEVAVREAIRLDPTDYNARANLASILFRRGDLAGAESAFREALRLNPDDLIARTNRAAVLQATGKLKEAADECREVIRLQPKCAEAHSTLGYVLFDLGDLKAAETAHRKAIDIWPQCATAHLGLGNALAEQGDLRGSEAEYREALHLNPRLPDAHFNLGITLRQKGKLAESETCHREAIRLDPNHAPAHNGLGNTLRDKGDLTGAIASFRRAIRARPKFAFAHNNLGIALAMHGDLEESAAAFRESLRISPGDAGTRQNLAKVLQMAAARDAAANPRERAPPPRPVH